jgi:hypothetical protein
MAYRCAASYAPLVIGLASSGIVSKTEIVRRFGGNEVPPCAWTHESALLLNRVTDGKVLVKRWEGFSVKVISRALVS